MKDDRRSKTVQRFTDAELDVFGEFSEAVRDGKNPSVEEYLQRVPKSAARLRPLLETDARLGVEIAKLRAEFPNVDLARLLDPGRRSMG